MCDFWVREYGALASLGALYILSVLITALLMRFYTSKYWKERLHEFAPARARNMIAHRDRKIEGLEERIKELEREKRSLVDTVRAAATFADRTREILTQPEVIRLRGEYVESGYRVNLKGGK